MEQSDSANARGELEVVVRRGAGQAADYKALADIYAGKGMRQQAMDAYREAIALSEDFFEAHANLGNLLLASGDADGAILHFRKAVVIRPDIAELYDSLGRAFLRKGSAKAAREVLLLALKIKPELATAHCNLGRAYLGFGQYDRAAACFARALALAPGLQVASIGLCRVRIQERKFAEAKALLAPLLARYPEEASLILLRARVDFLLGSGERALAGLNQLMQRPTLMPGIRKEVLFLQGQILGEQGDSAAAFSNYRAANEVLPSRFDRQALNALVDRLTGSRHLKNGAVVSSPAGEKIKPVFVVGMPRSGKSLIGKLLAMHPEVAVVDEDVSILDAQKLFAHKKSLASDSLELLTAELTADDLRELGADYLALAKEYSTEEGRSVMDGDVAHFVTTSPGQIFHIGLIRQLFPSAPIIHAVRHPVDTCLACYFKDFAGTENDYSKDLSDLAFYYRQYQRLMHHWQTTLGIRMLEVRYEELVTDTDNVRDQLYEFVGLSTGGMPDEGVNGVFSEQHIGNWRRYEVELQPLIEGLGQYASH